MKDAVNMVKSGFRNMSLDSKAIPGKPWNLFGFLLDFVKYVIQIIGLHMVFILLIHLKLK